MANDVHISIATSLNPGRMFSPIPGRMFSPIPGRMFSPIPGRMFSPIPGDGATVKMV